MWPVVPRRGERPFAFSNPLFVDADGGGYDHYPLQELIDRLLSAKSGPVPFEGHGHVLVGEPGTPEWVGSLFEHLSCAH